MKRLGIHSRLLLGVFLLIAATTFALGYMGAKITHQFVESRFVERMSFLAKYLALNAELGILIDDRAMLKRLATNLLSEKDVVGVAVVDAQGQELTSVWKKIGAPFSVLEEPVLFKEAREESKAFTWGPGESRGSELIGKVVISYSTSGIDQLSTTMRTRFAWLSAGLACLAGLIFFFISRSLVFPVTQLAQAARQVAEGDLALRVRPGGPPETSGLASAFNAMLDSLASSRKALEDANEAIIRQEALAEVGKFSLMVAHEVKNPLSIIKSSLDILKKDPADPSNETMTSYMEDEIRRLNRLIEDFLAFARPAKPTMRLVDLNKMVDEIVSRFKIQHVNSDAVITSHVPAETCFVHADADLLMRGLGNIIKNAYEANGQKGLVRVTASMDEHKWVVDVEDQGAGIAEEYLEKIFEPFFTTRSKGTGLGLAYAFQVVKAHGGTITASNRKERGALFRVALPTRGDGDKFQTCEAPASNE